LGEKQKFYSIFFKKLWASKGQRPWRTPQSAEPYRSGAFGGKFVNPSFGLTNRGVAREKPPLETAEMHHPEKPPSGRFFVFGAEI